MLHGDSLDFEYYPYRLNNAWRPGAGLTIVISYFSVRRFKCNVGAQPDVILYMVYCMRQVAIPFNKGDKIPSWSRLGE